MESIQFSSRNILAEGIALPVACTVCMYFRFVARKRGTALGIDDILALFAHVLLCVMSGLLIAGVLVASFGSQTAEEREQMPLDDEKTVTAGHLQFLIVILLGPALGCTKLSMLFFYRRLFRGISFNILSWVLIVAIIMWTVFFFFLLLFLCGSNVNYLWTQTGEPVDCLSYEPIAISMSATDVGTDIAIIVLPIYYTTQLQIDRPRKLLVVIAFLFGSVAVLASLARLIGLTIIYNNGTSLLAMISFVTYISVFELGLAVVATNLPAFGGFALNLVRRVVSPSARMAGSSRASNTARTTPNLQRTRATTRATTRPGSYVNLDAQARIPSREGSVEGVRCSVEAFAEGQAQECSEIQEGEITVTIKTSQTTSPV